MPYLSGERTPFMTTQPRAAWVGLALHHTVDDLLWAALVGVACSVRLGVETLDGVGEPLARVRLVGGSARYRVWRTLLRSVVGRRFSYTQERDATARGAMRLAMRAVGDEQSAAAVVPRFTLVEGGGSRSWEDDYYARYLDTYRRLWGDSSPVRQGSEGAR